MKRLRSFVMMSMLGPLVGCVEPMERDEEAPGLVERSSGDESTIEDLVPDLSSDPSETALVLHRHYCVGQSYASVYHLSQYPWYEEGYNNQCTEGRVWPYNMRLHQGHPVKVLRNCGGGTHVIVQSLWNTSVYYWMRADALRSC